MRHAFLSCYALLLLVTLFPSAAAAQPFTCSVLGSSGALLPATGMTELVADYLVLCTGGVPTPTGQPIPSYTITATLNATITSRLVSGNVSEALLLLDEAWPPAGQAVPSNIIVKPPSYPYQILCMPQGVLGGACAETGTGGSPNPYSTQPNVFVGTLTAPNQIAWANVPIDAPGAGSFSFRITNIRVNASQLALQPGVLQASVVMMVSIVGTPSIAIDQSSQSVAIAARDFGPGSIPSSGFARCRPHNASLLGGTGSPAFDFNVGAVVASEAFKRRNLGLSPDGSIPPLLYAQNVPSYDYKLSTHSGFYFPALFTPAPGIGLADFGTRLLVTFNNVLPGTHLFLPTTVIWRALDTPGGAPFPVAPGIFDAQMRLVQADQYGNSPDPWFIAVPPTASVAGTPVAEVNYSGSGAYAVYEVLNSIPTLPQVPRISVAVAFNSTPSGMPLPGQTTASLSLAPTGGPLASNPTADATSRIPRFAPSNDILNAYSINVCAAGEDFSGTGRSSVLTYDPASGTTYIALSNGNGTYQYIYNLFTSAFDILRTGDFNGDGKADLVLYNSHTALAYIGLSNGDGTFAFQSLFWSPGYNIVEPGDIDGDGKTDFALYNSTTGTLYTGISNGTGGFTYKYHLVSTGFTYVRLADFTGDGLADLFLYNSGTGLASLGVGDGTGNFTMHPLFISPGYDFADSGDLNGDGKADVILYNSTNGNAATGISDGTGGFVFTPTLFSPGFTSVRLADYTGDGKADVTVYNKNTAIGYFGTGNGAGGFTFQSLFWSPGYDWVVPEDVNADGKVDIVLYNSVTGTSYTGISNGSAGFTYTYSLWGPGKVLAR